MKYHLVYNTRTGKLKGHIPSKEWFKRIQHERPDKEYKLVSVKEEELSHRVISELDYKEACIVYERVMFEDEYETFHQSFDQMLMDIYARIQELIARQLPLLKMSEDDKLAVEAYAQFMFEFIREAQSAIENEDEVFEEDVYFDPGKLAQTIIDQYG